MTQATPSTTIRLFIITGVDRLPPTYIAAASEDDARRVFLEFMAHHSPFHSGKMRQVVESSATWLANRPQLSAAINDANDSGKSGVAWWLGHRAGWVVRPAKSKPVGYLAAEEPEVQYYRFDNDDGLDLAVFAFDPDEAIRFFAIWHQCRFDALRADFYFQRLSPWLLIGDQLTLREEMTAGLIGVAAQCSDGAWRIVSPDDLETG